VLGVWRHRQQMGLGWLEDDGDNQTTTWSWWGMLGVLSVGCRVLDVDLMMIWQVVR
jgi:hypothetical protein